MSVTVPLFLSSMDHNDNAALRLFGPPSIFDEDLYLPPLPPNTVMETNFEALVRIGRELDLIENQQVSSAVEMYRRFGFDENDRPYWGYCVESACNIFTNESLLLIRSEEEDGVERTLRWVPRDSVYTWRHAELFHNEQYVGPSEGVMREILALFRDVFEYAAKSDWSYEKRLEFYHSFPFEEMSTREDVMAFRSILFGCPAFEGFEFTFPECER